LNCFHTRSKSSVVCKLILVPIKRGLKLQHLVTKNMVSKFHKFTFWCQGALKMITPIFFMKNVAYIFKKKLQHFLKKNNNFNPPSPSPPTAAATHTRTHTHTISNELKYTNYYSCLKLREIPQFDHGQANKECAITLFWAMCFYYPTKHMSIKVEHTLLSLMNISDRSMYSW
jgi:hypothetical protein